MGGGTLLAIYLTVMAILIGGFFFLRKKFRKEEGIEDAPAAGRRGVQPAAGAAAAPVRRGALDRMRRGPAGGAAAAGAAANDERKEGGHDSGSEDDEDGPAAAGGPIDPRDKKALRKAEKAAARVARADMRAAQEAQNSHKQAKADKYAEKLAAREAEREAAEKEAAALEAARAEAQRKKDAAEFDEWKDMFTVSDSGQAAGADDEKESQDQLEDFINKIKTRKVVVLDELAAEFKMKTPDVIARIQAMEADGRLTGVLDDRGKFLSITTEELDSVAKWINKRGRVTVADLVAESNKLIDLNGTAEEGNEQLVLDEEDSKEQKS